MKPMSAHLRSILKRWTLAVSWRHHPPWLQGCNTYYNHCLILAIHPPSCLHRSTDATQKNKTSSGHTNVTNVITHQPPSPSHPTQPDLTKGRGDDGRGYTDIPGFLQKLIRFPCWTIRLLTHRPLSVPHSARRFASSAPLFPSPCPTVHLGDHGISKAASGNRTVIKNATGGPHDGMLTVLPPG